MDQIIQHFGGGCHHNDLSKEDMDIFLMMYPLFEKIKGKYYYKNRELSNKPLDISDDDEGDVLVVNKGDRNSGPFLLVNFDIQLGQYGSFFLSREHILNYNSGILFSDETVLCLHDLGIKINNNISGSELPIYDIDEIKRREVINNIINT